ncbi:MAG: DUF4411 family protein [Methanobrevibacter sp.]|jgi:hypothetical protein|nr:DUF4411 family protein [Candidatus Methanovirga meridionalis]
MKYLVDTSTILLGSKYETYERKYFPKYWNNFDILIHEGEIVSTKAVYNELIAKDDDFKSWANENKNIFHTPGPEVLICGNKLSQKFPNWYQTGMIKQNWADPELIAFAKIHDLVLVTQEKWNNGTKTKKENYKIPTICEKIGAKCHIGDKFHENIENQGF